MSRKTVVVLVALILIIVTLTGCVPGDGKNSANNPAGFFWGIWHGWIAPISLVIGIFKDSVRIYESHNTGWWYDLGFYIAVISGFGGISLSRRRKRNEN